MDPRSIKRILVPTDFSEPSGEAVATAIAFARAFAATIDLVHVTVEATYALPPPVDVATVPIDMTKVMDQAAKSLAAEEARVRAAGVACESTLLVGRPDAEIVAQADKTAADLIVMGTHGRGGLGHAILGSVAERVVQHAHRPVLIVPRPRPPAA
jgi:nucleotide-binding universal stress UspA family protein